MDENLFTTIPTVYILQAIHKENKKESLINFFIN